MVVFHGNGGTGAKMENTTGFSPIADANGFFAAYPDSNPNYAQGAQWQITGTGSDDLAFSLKLIAAIKASYSIDASRVYISGFSEGGGMVEALACMASDQLAGAADVSENLGPGVATRCKPAKPITFVFFHGTADPVSYYDGSNYKGGNTYSSQKTAEFWAGKNGCNMTPTKTTFADTLSDGSKVTDNKQVWSGCSLGASVTFYTITGGGHAWPGDTDGGKYGPSSVGLNASQIIWQILSAARR